MAIKYIPVRSAPYSSKRFVIPVNKKGNVVGPILRVTPRIPALRKCIYGVY